MSTGLPSMTKIENVSDNLCGVLKISPPPNIYTFMMISTKGNRTSAHFQNNKGTLGNLVIAGSKIFPTFTNKL